MSESRFTVLLRIEPFVLRTAMRDCLAADPRLKHFDVRLDGQLAGHRQLDRNSMHADSAQPFVLGVELSDPPENFAITFDGRTSHHPYMGLDDLAVTLADVANARRIAR